MSFPLEILSQLPGAGLIVALVTGVGFGFVLERSGFGRSTKLAAQFYLHDMTVFKVMFTGIVTAMVSLVLADGAGLVDFEAVARGAASVTYLWPMLVGGLLLGAGFIISGYCPGTSAVAAASGNVDGMVTFFGVMIGSVVYGELYGLIGAFASSSDLGQFFLPELLGLSWPVVAVLVTAMAVAAFFGAEWVERRFARTPEGAQRDPARLRTRHRAFAALGAAAVVGLLVALVAAPSAARPPRRPEQVLASTLARRLVDEPWKVRVLDLRGEAAWTKAQVPGSEPVEPTKLADLGLDMVKSGPDVVLVDARTVDVVPPALAGYGGRVYTLRDGFGAWQAYALTTPRGAGGSAEERDRLAFRAAYNAVITGQAAAAPSARPVAKTAARRPRKGGGCQ